MNKATYMQIFGNNIEILLFLSVTCQLEKEIRKKRSQKRRDRFLFSHWCTPSPNFLNTKSITSPTHVHRLPYRLYLWAHGNLHTKHQFSGGFNANFFGTWTNWSNLFSYCRSNRRPCQLVIIHRAKKRNGEGRN